MLYDNICWHMGCEKLRLFELFQNMTEVQFIKHSTQWTCLVVCTCIMVNCRWGVCTWRWQWSWFGSRQLRTIPGRDTVEWQQHYYGEDLSRCYQPWAQRRLPWQDSSRCELVLFQYHSDELGNLSTSVEFVTSSVLCCSNWFNQPHVLVAVAVDNIHPSLPLLPSTFLSLNSVVETNMWESDWICFCTTYVSVANQL